jgi:hypothetical protein
MLRCSWRKESMIIGLPPKNNVCHRISVRTLRNIKEAPEPRQDRGGMRTACPSLGAVIVRAAPLVTQAAERRLSSLAARFGWRHSPDTPKDNLRH